MPLWNILMLGSLARSLSVEVAPFTATDTADATVANAMNTAGACSGGALVLKSCRQTTVVIEQPAKPGVGIGSSLPPSRQLAAKGLHESQAASAMNRAGSGQFREAVWSSTWASISQRRPPWM